VPMPFCNAASKRPSTRNISLTPAASPPAGEDFGNLLTALREQVQTLVKMYISLPVQLSGSTLSDGYLEPNAKGCTLFFRCGSTYRRSCRAVRGHSYYLLEGSPRPTRRARRAFSRLRSLAKPAKSKLC
jgi:hypothetical protein